MIVRVMIAGTGAALLMVSAAAAQTTTGSLGQPGAQTGVTASGQPYQSTTTPTPAYGSTTAPAYGTTSTPAYGSTTPAPAYGAQAPMTTPAGQYGADAAAQTAPYGAAPAATGTYNTYGSTAPAVGYGAAPASAGYGAAPAPVTTPTYPDTYRGTAAQRAGERG